MSIFKSIRSKLLLVLIPLIFLLIGLFTLKDYGITWDEPENFYAGRVYLNTYLYGNLSFLDKNAPLALKPELPFRVENHWERYPPFAATVSSIFSLIFSDWLKITNAVFASHLTIVLFASTAVLFTVFITFEMTGSVFYSSFAGMVLGLIPHFFGHSHNNIKDIPYTAMATVTIYFYLRFIKIQKAKYLICTGMLFGICMATKFNAIFLLPLFTVYSLAVYRKKIFNLNKYLALITAAGILSLLIFFILWPWLLTATFSKLYSVYLYATQVARGMPVLFMGKTYSAGENLPIYYALVMLAVTLPFSVLLLTLIGIIPSFLAIFSDNTSKRYRSLPFIWLILVIIRYSFPFITVYNGIRHFFEVLPAVAISAALAVMYITKNIKAKLSLKFIISSLVFIQLIYINITTHPYQMLYFNSLAGGMGQASHNFEFDYWGFSIKDLVSILNRMEQDKNKKVNIAWINFNGSYFPGNKFSFISDDKTADYIIIPNSECYFDKYKEYWQKNGKLVYILRKEDADIGYIYKNKSLPVDNKQ